MAVFRRVWELSLEIGGNIKTYKEREWGEQSLRIEFAIRNAVGGGLANGDITITNLNNQDMQLLSTAFSNRGRFKSNYIQLLAGYPTNTGIICNGNFSELSTDFESVDKSVTFKVVGKIQNNLENNSIQTSKEGATSLQAICQECAAKNGLGLRYDEDIGTRNLQDFSFLGTPFQYIEKIRSLYKDLLIFIDDTSDTLCVQKIEKKAVNTQILSNETGLIGKPKPTYLGCNVRTLLNPSLKAGNFIELKNAVLKDYDGKYRIQELIHRGSNRSTLWETELILIRS